MNPRRPGKKFHSFSYAVTASDATWKMNFAFSVYKKKNKEASNT
jgi:hypothetical protein